MFELLYAPTASKLRMIDILSYDPEVVRTIFFEYLKLF